MVIEKWIIGLILFILIDAIVTTGLYLAWVKKKTNNKVVPDAFPYNATKKQAVLWHIFWTIAVYLNLAVYSLVSWLFARGSDPNEGMLYISAFVIVLVGYSIVMFIIYAIVKSLVAKKIK